MPEFRILDTVENPLYVSRAGNAAGACIGPGPEREMGIDAFRYYIMEDPNPKADRHRIRAYDAGGGWPQLAAVRASL